MPSTHARAPPGLIHQQRAGISLASSCVGVSGRARPPCVPPVRCLEDPVCGEGERASETPRTPRRVQLRELAGPGADGTIRCPALRSVERRGEVVEQGIDNTGGVGF